MSGFFRRKGWIIGCAGFGLRLAASWGVDASLSTHVDSDEFPRYLELLAGTGLVWIGERGVETCDSASQISISQREKFAQIRATGHRIAAYAYLDQLRSAQPGNALSEDLLAVYRAGRELGIECHGLVDTWQMVTEADIGYCRDLPERVVAYQKALYLGIKEGAAEAQLKLDCLSPPKAEPKVDRLPLVLMGALGTPVSPWLERAGRNGLLYYSDAYNFHFYGNAETLPGEITAHADAARRLSRESHSPGSHRMLNQRHLPIWITECGLNLIKPGDFLNPERRRWQADFTVQTAKAALAAPAVAVFMPFILTHKDDPFALTLSASQPLPAWDAYAKFTCENPWPANRPLAAPPVDPNPVVVQWLPDNKTTIPHKVGGTYRFRGDAPIAGELRIYNFGKEAVTGVIEGNESHHVRIELDAAFAGERYATTPAVWTRPVTVAPGAMVTIGARITPRTAGYFREFWGARFVDQRGGESPLFFGFERVPELRYFVSEALPVSVRPPERPEFPMYPGFSVSGRSGPWLALNGLELKSEPDGWLRLTTPQLLNDPYFRTIAVASLPTGLPPHGMIRIRLDRQMSPKVALRVDLLDSEGRRFTIFENFGFSYYETADQAWLNFEDFHTLSWGAAAGDGRFRPELAREIQLRLQSEEAGGSLAVKLEMVRLPEESFNRWGDYEMAAALGSSPIQTR